MSDQSRDQVRDQSRARDPVVFKYYGFQLFFSLLIWMPVFYEYQIRIGLTAEQIFGIQSAYYLAFCLFEIPTGLIADAIGYRSCMIFGSAFLVVANLMPIVSPDFSGMMIHFLLIALSRSLISGAASAYIYDYLADRDQKSEYKKVEGRARAYGLIAKILTWSAVGAMMKLSLTLPYSTTAFASLISVGFALKLPKTRLQNKIDFASSLTIITLKTRIRDWASALKLVRGERLLLIVMIQGVGLFVLSRIVQVNLFQPIVMMGGFHLGSFGWIMSAMTVFEALGSAYPNSVRKIFSDLNAVYALTLLMAFSLILLPFSWGGFTMLNLCLFSLSAGLSYPIQRQLMNDVIPSHAPRATLLSVESILDRACTSGAAALVGLFALNPQGITRLLIGSALMTVIVVAALATFTALRSPSRPRLEPKLR